MTRTVAVLALLAVLSAGAGDFHDWAPTPPMGWNSFDGYGTLVDEAAVRANADWQAAHLLKFGYDTCVVDIRWTVQNETGTNEKYNQKDPVFTLDEWGRYLPDPKRFPSGFRALADDIHAKGLKFGIHIMRGVPREAARRKLPIKGADGVTCDQIGDGRDECSWLKDNWGVDPSKPGAQAYYDSIAELYAGWGVDFIKCDDMTFYPYHAGEIELLRKAIDRCGRRIVLSLSPGETPLDQAEHVAAHANMWRIVGDLWDDWGAVDHLTDVACDWLGKKHVAGAWPDCDMIPLGRLCVRGYDGARSSRLTPDEARYLMTLMAAVRSPLMIGSDLPSLAGDPGTLALLTDPLLLEMHRDGVEVRCERRTRNDCAIVVRTAAGKTFVALFNRSGESRWIYAAGESETLPPHSAKIKVKEIK